jgi:hypothetical protein
MTHILEKRQYGPDSSPEEREAIRAMVYMHRSDVLYWKEVPVMSVWQVEQFKEKIDELTEELDEFSILIDLTNSKPPDARTRAALRNVFTPLGLHGMKRAAAFTGKNFFINVAAKFVLGGSGLKFSVHSTQEAAEKALARND